MEDFIALTVVVLVVGAVMGFAALLAVGMLLLMAVYGLMHATAAAYRFCGGRDWRGLA